MEKIDNLDRQILEIIMRNARIPSKDVAAECGVSRAAIHQRIQRMIDMNVIVGSGSVSYKHLRAHETGRNLVCRLMLEKKKKVKNKQNYYTTISNQYPNTILSPTTATTNQ